MKGNDSCGAGDDLAQLVTIVAAARRCSEFWITAMDGRVIAQSHPRPMPSEWLFVDEGILTCADDLRSELADARQRALCQPSRPVTIDLGDAVIAIMAAVARDSIGENVAVLAYEITPRDSTPAAALKAAGLTQAESRVAMTMARGGTASDAALELGVSRETIRTHLKSVYSKLGVHSRTQLSELLRHHLYK